MRGGARDDHQRTLPDRLCPKASGLVPKRDLLERVHAGDLDVAARGDRLDAVFGLPPPRRPKTRAEPDEEFLDLDIEGPGDAEVRRLMDEDHHEEGDEERDLADRSGQGNPRLAGFDDLGGPSTGPGVGPFQGDHRDH